MKPLNYLKKKQLFFNFLIFNFSENYLKFFGKISKNLIFQRFYIPDQNCHFSR